LGLCRRTCYRTIGCRVAISPPELDLRFNRLQEFKSPRLRKVYNWYPYFETIVRASSFKQASTSIGITLVQIRDFVTNELKRSNEDLQTTSLIGRIPNSVVNESPKMDSPAIVLRIAKQTNVGVVGDRYTRRK